MLLITGVGGIDDSKLRSVAPKVAAAGDVALFQTKARNVARLLPDRQGVDIDRVPALVVLAPMGVTGDGPPVASDLLRRSAATRACSRRSTTPATTAGASYPLPDARA